jgi:uncharacterized protein (DUF1501 family)
MKLPDKGPRSPNVRSPLSRRRFLEIVGVAGGAVALRTGLSPFTAHASGAPPRYLLSVYFSGGWDQLLLLDPRDNTAFTAANAAQTRILPAYDRVLDPWVTQVLSGNPSGIQQFGNLRFGPAMPEALTKHAADLAICRGVTMDTLTHEVGRRYFITGKFPRGLAANGSAMTTAVAAQRGQALDLPNLNINAESYNEGMPAYASPVSVRTAEDVRSVLRPLGLQLTGDSDSALEAYEAEATCEQTTLDGHGLATLYRDSRAKARSMLKSQKYDLFAFSLTAPGPEVATLLQNMQISTTADLNGPKGRAALAAHALAMGVSQAVSVNLQGDLDDHNDWEVDHATKLRNGMEALGLLIDHLKGMDDPGGVGKVWDHTGLMVFSEFARTPLINGRDGRDHHLASSALIAGPGIRGNTQVGATSDVGMAAQKIDFGTGLVSAAGHPLRPADINATLLHGLGLSWEHLSNQEPRLVEALLP